MMQRLAVLLPIWALTACQSGSVEDQSAGDHSGTGVTQVLASDVVTELPAEFALVYRDSDPIPDRDDDGIVDELDPWPDSAPLEATDPIPDFSVISQRESADGPIDLDNIVVSGSEVRITLSGYNDSSPLWVQWRGDGQVISERVQFGQNTLRAPEIRVNQIALIHGNQISAGVPISGYLGGEPWLYPVEQQSFMVDSRIRLLGENLDQVDSFSMGRDSLKFSLDGNHAVKLLLPALPASNYLTLHANSDQSSTQHMALSMQRKVKLSPSQAIQNSAWGFSQNDQSVLIDNAPEVLIEAGTPQPFYSIHPQRQVRVSAIIWPDQTQVTLGAESTLEHWFSRTQNLSGQSRGDWMADRASLPDLSHFTDLLHAIKQDIIADNGASAERYAELLESGIAWQSASSSSSSSSSTISSGSSGMLAARSAARFPAGTAPLYDQTVSVTNHRSIPGRSSHALIGLELFGDPVGCLGFENITRPSDLWPSDLCVANSSPTFLSIAVKDRNGRLVRDHIAGNTTSERYLHKDMVGAGWLAIPSPKSYLTTDAGSALCRMQECSVEVITGGWGLGTSSSLNSREKTVQGYVFTRTMIESVIIDTIASLIGGSKSTAACWAKKHLIDEAANLAKIVAKAIETNNKLQAAPNKDEAAKIIVELFGGEIFALLKSELIKVDVLNPSCADASKLSSELAQVSAASASLPYRIAQIANQIVKNLTTAYTPKKLVFEVIPKAQVLGVSSAVNAEDSNDYLTIRGCHISNQTFDLSTQQPDPAKNYWPDAIFSDRHGRAVRFALNESYLQPLAALCQSQYTIPVTQLAPALDSLSSGPISVSLRIKFDFDSSEFADFPNSELPVPGKTFIWQGPLKLSEIKDGYLRPGLVNTLRGDNLELLKNEAMTVYLDNGSQPVKITDVRYRNEEIDFFVPLALPPGTYTIRVVTGSSPGGGVTLSEAVSTEPVKFSYLKLSDTGKNHDDAMHLELTDNVAHSFSVNNTPVSASLSDTSAKRFVTHYFNGEGLVTDSGEAINPPLKLYLFCEEDGGDGCTWSVEAKVVLPDGTSYAAKDSGKLEKGAYQYITLQ